MNPDTFIQYFSSFWAIFLVVLFFGASIFVHELGHFLAALRRGLKIERFSIGFGPKLFSWNRGGVEYCISALPLGGYVALPQLADMGALEGGDKPEDEKLPPLSYADKMIVSVMGAVFNVLFAFVLATVLWGIGRPATETQKTTTIGYVMPEIANAEGENVESPALKSGLLAGDRVLQIDGNPIRFWTDLQQALVTGSGRTPDRKPQTILKVERDNQVLDIEIIPLLSGADKLRKIGVIPAEQMVIDRLYENSPAARAGLLSGDRILALDGAAIYTSYAISRYLEKYPEKLIEVTIERDGEKIGFPMKPESVVITTEGDTTPSFGLVIQRKLWLEHINPLNQVYDVVVMTVNVLGALFSRHSDIGLDKLSGPVGIFDVLYKTALNDIRWFLYILVLINVNLAILNLLPIPVLDGGHMAFATIARLRGKALPPRFIAASQSLFVVLFFSLLIYVSIFDFRRVGRDQKEEREYQQRLKQSVEPVFQAPMSGEPSTMQP